MLLAAGCVPSLLSVMNGAEIDVPYPPLWRKAPPGWRAHSLRAEPGDLCVYWSGGVSVLRLDPGGSSTSAAHPLACPGACTPGPYPAGTDGAARMRISGTSSASGSAEPAESSAAPISSRVILGCKCVGRLFAPDRPATWSHVYWQVTGAGQMSDMPISKRSGCWPARRPQSPIRQRW